jgi:hypothetical protein
MSVKLKKSFARQVEALIGEARDIRTAMINNANFTNMSSDLVAALAKVSELIDRLQLAIDEAKDHGSAKIAYRDQLAKALAAQLQKVAQLVEIAADGNVDALKSSGFKVLTGGNVRHDYQLLAPKARLIHGPQSRTLLLRGVKLKGAWRYDVDITEGDPTVEDSWSRYGSYPNCRGIEILGRTPGKYCSARLRGVWPNGEEGPWSAVVTLMSL